MVSSFYLRYIFDSIRTSEIVETVSRHYSSDVVVVHLRGKFCDISSNSLLDTSAIVFSIIDVGMSRLWRMLVLLYPQIETL